MLRPQIIKSVFDFTSQTLSKEHKFSSEDEVK